MTAAGTDRVQDLEDRLERLERVVEGLQDALYSESRRQNDRVSELRSRIEPAEMARAISDDARKRGL
jgi:hypothetical protein